MRVEIDVNLTNEKAIETLDKGNWYDAQQLFRENVKRNLKRSRIAVE